MEDPALPNMGVKSNGGSTATSKAQFIFRFVLLCSVSFCHVFAVISCFYNMNEYAYDFIRLRDYPGVILNKSKGSTCDLNFTTDGKTIESNIQAEASKWSVYIALSAGVPALITTTLFSMLSDIYGRKPFLLLAVAGTCIKNVLVSLAIHLRLQIAWLVLFTFIEGATGTWIVVLSVSFAYVADVTVKGKSRTIFIVTYELVIQFASAIGGFVVGFYVDSVGFLYPQITASGLAALGVVGICFLPNSRRSESGNRQKLIKQFKSMMQFFRNGIGTKRWKYILSLCTMFLIWMGSLGQGSITIFYTMGSPFCFTHTDVSIFNTSSVIFQNVCGIILIKVLQHFVMDEIIAVFPLCSAVASYTIMGSAQNTIMLIIGKQLS